MLCFFVWDINKRKEKDVKHYTRDIGKRAEHIADREAKKYYQETGGDFFKKWLETYSQAFKELAGK